jgi:hemerythrin-like domain-containing protein
MSTTPATPDLSSYYLIHRALRAAARQLAVAAAASSPNDRDRVRAMRRYWNGYAGEVLIHHTLEDDVFFPGLVERVPVAAELVGRLGADHHVLDEQMDDVRAAMEVLDTPAGPGLAAVRLRALSASMDEHLDVEDADLLPLFGRHYSVDEYEALGEAAVKSLGIGKQAAFTVPFAVSYMSDDERAHALAEAPLAMRVLYRLTRRGYTKLAVRALGPGAVVVPSVGEMAAAKAVS